MGESVDLRILRYARDEAPRSAQGEWLGAFAETFSEANRDVSRQDASAAMWQLVAKGLLHIDARQQGAEVWRVAPTARGRKLLDGERLNPDDRSGYVAAIKTSVPRLSAVVERYLSEATEAYWNGLYLASAVTLGVASEHAFFEMATCAAPWMTKRSLGKRFIDEMEKENRSINAAFRRFREAIEAAVAAESIPRELYENLSIELDAVLDLIRTYRNTAAHKSPQDIDQDGCYTLLQVIARGYLRRMYALCDFFAR